MSYKAGFRSTSRELDNLFAGDFPRVEMKVTIEAGEGELSRGSVLGKEDDGEFVLSVEESTDGSEDPIAILAEDVDATSEVEALVYLSGEFNENALTFGAGHTADDLRFVLAARGIYLHPTVEA